MIHAKLLMRRLAYVPWLLAAGLVLGWVGEAAAQDTQDVALSGSTSVREDAGAQDVAVKATVDADATADIYVTLGLKDKQTGFNTRFRITLPTLMIPKGKKEATGTITFTPILADSPGGQTTDGKDIPDDNVDLPVILLGYAGSNKISGDGSTDGTDHLQITLIDAHKTTMNITLSLEPKDGISKEAGPTTITVIATVDGETVNSKQLSFPLVIDTAEQKDADGKVIAQATRDTDYTLTGLGNITIPKKKVSGTATFTITPKKPGSVWIGTPSGTDLRYNAVAVADDAKTLLIDESLDGKAKDGTETKEEAEITVTSGSIEIKDTAIAASKGLTASPVSIREEVGQREITLTVELEKVLTSDAAVSFTIKDITGASRDINYTAVVGDLTIPADSTKGTTTLTLTPINDTGMGNKVIEVSAKVGSVSKSTLITITDDDSFSKLITLSASPAEIKEDAGETEVTITATLDGKVLEEDTTLTLVLNTAKVEKDDATGQPEILAGSAQRDVDYKATIRSVTIPAGEVSGSTTISIDPENDGIVDADETIVIKSLTTPKNGDDENIYSTGVTITLKDTGVPAAGAADPEDSTPAFSEADIAASDTAIEGVAGTALDAMELPAATAGDGDLTYSVSSNLPAGLAFDAATRMVSGTPAADGTTEIVYTVIDSKLQSAALTYTIEVSMPPQDPGVAVASVSATHSSLREDDEEATEITLTATLTKASATAQKVTFTIGAPSSGAVAVRDVDYTAALGGKVTIAAGATQGTTTLILTPIDNDATDGNRSLGVTAAVPGGSAQTDIKIADDNTASTSISLSVSPHTVSEDASVTQLTVTATLDGKVLDAAAIVTISVDGASAATRDVDYSALFNPLLTIPAGSVSGSIALLIDPTADGVDEGNETITLNGAIAALGGGSAMITLSDAEAAMPPVVPEMDPLAFAGSVDAQSYTAGTTVSLELPEATGGAGGAVYTVSGLPAGLEFDDSTRTVSGTPEAEGSAEVTYTATDSDETSVSLTFSITVNPPLSFGDFFGLFNNGAGKANPASEHDEGVLQIVVGQPYSLTLPAVVSGGTPPLTYSVTGLPAGLSFDPATRTVSGTPTEVSEVVPVIYTVTDGNGASKSVPFLVAVVEPSLDAPDELVAADYKGADGAGDQGGFILLTWPLSGDHDTLDGYRIFREIPFLNNEMVPWAMVDAVPRVQIGRAIVATLDTVATKWGIAAERDGRITNIVVTAKAAFVRAENLNQPYELMAETLMASREAAAVSDAPVFASLLPEALAFAQGAVPKLNLVAGVLESSAITLTEEPARAIDDIAPLAVPSISVLDAPNDQGSRILLTWTLSPSDQLLQGVVTEAVGPAAVESVVGVHGYGIHRRAAGEDEFVLVAQVEAGVASFVDETALNGVRYTYQVRAYDLDNETGSDVEQTAMAVRNRVLDSEGRALYGLFGADNRIGFDDFFLFADNFGLTTEDAGFDPAFDLSPSAAIDFDDFFVFADNFGRSTAAAGKRVPMFAGLNADARLYLDARTTLPIVGEDFVLDVRVADFTAVKGYGLQVQYDASKLEFVEALTEQPLGGSELAAPQVLSDEAGVLALVAHGDVVSDGEVALSLVFRTTTEIENTVIEITDSETYDSEFGFNRLALPAPVALQTRPEAFGLANNYPNPFNPATTIKYALPTAADVELTVYNVVGQVVRTLVAEHQSAGRYVVEWDATNDNGHSLSSGMYFYRLEAGGEFLEVKKMLLLK